MTTLHPTPIEAGPSSRYPIGAGYPRRHAPRIVVIEPRRYLAVCGTEAPGGPEFQAAMGALYGSVYPLVFRLRDRGIEAHVQPSEALWERRDGQRGWATGDEAFDHTAWHWTLLMPLPAEAGDEDVRLAIAIARTRKASPELDRVHEVELDEGLVVEAMHVGPYADEPATIEAMRRKAEAEGLALDAPDAAPSRGP